MKIAIISVSMRNGRRSHQVAEALYERLVTRNLETELIDLMELDIPRFTGSESFTGDIPMLSEKLNGMDAFIFVTPEYNSGYPSGLKDMIDHLKRDIFRKKPIGISTVSSGAMAGTLVGLQLQLIILGIFAFPIPHMLMVGNVDSHFEDGKVREGVSLAKSIDTFIDEYLWFSEAIIEKKSTYLS